MDFTSIEKDQVESYWIDISQDPDFISQDSGIDKDKVLGILKSLSDESKIKNFEFEEKSKVKSFTEMFRIYNS